MIPIEEQIVLEAREEWFSHYRVVGERAAANRILDSIIIDAIKRAVAIEHELVAREEGK